jgi:nucleoid-associated protein YgaU
MEDKKSPPKTPSWGTPRLRVRLPRQAPAPSPRRSLRRRGTTGGAPAGENRYTQWYEVKSGDTLWKIAKEHYGDGNLYTEIFKANQDVLTDPTRSRSDRSCGFPESPL